VTPEERVALSSAVRTAAVTVLGGDERACSDADVRTAERIASAAVDLYAGPDAPERPAALRELPRSSLFVRQQAWVPVEVAVHFDAVLVASRIERRAKRGSTAFTNNDMDWYAEVRATGTDIVLWDWMVPPHIWDRRLSELFASATAVGARGVLLNVEPGSGDDKHHPMRDWRGKGDELRAFTQVARDLADEHGLELWVTSWALPPRSFDLAALCEFADVCIPQPYEVHGRTGPEYVAEVLEAWREAGARRIVLGRGAHELDPSDDDAWRTPAQIEAHRKTTPRGMPEAWWPAAGSLAKRGALVDAMVS
jgi:hypothetical protein